MHKTATDLLYLPIPPQTQNQSPLRARLTLTHLKTKILRPLAEASHIKSVAVREEGKKRATFGWVVGKLPPAMKAAARAAAEQQQRA